MCFLTGYYCHKGGFSDGSSGKEFTCNAGDRFDPCVGKSPCRRKWQPTPVFLPEKSHGQRSLTGYSPNSHRVGHDWATKHETNTQREKMLSERNGTNRLAWCRIVTIQDFSTWKNAISAKCNKVKHNRTRYAYNWYFFCFFSQFWENYIKVTHYDCGCICFKYFETILVKQI